MTLSDNVDAVELFLWSGFDLCFVFVYCFFTCRVRVVHIQGENGKETEAWFDVLSKALQVDIFNSPAKLLHL